MPYISDAPERGRDFPDLSSLRGAEDDVARLARAYENARMSLIAMEDGQPRSRRFSQAELRTTLHALSLQISCRLGN